MPYREKRITSGRYLEVEIYPVSVAETKKSRKAKTKESLPKQKNLNHKNARKHLTRLINANFTNKDIALHMTYSNDHLPESPEQAQKDVRNFIRRVKTRLKKHGKDAKQFKYITVIEARGADGRKARIHHHLICSGMLSRDELESIWGKGWANADRLQADNNGYAALARYITKDPEGSKRWTSSMNLIKPKISVNDHKYSKRKVERLFKEFDRNEIERIYKGYRFIDFTAEVNKVNDGIYLNFSMVKLE